jgi:hypothetical protein
MAGNEWVWKWVWEWVWESVPMDQFQDIHLPPAAWLQKESRCSAAERLFLFSWLLA